MSIPDFHALLRELEPYGWHQSNHPPGLWRDAGMDQYGARTQFIKVSVPGRVYELFGAGVQFFGTLDAVARKAKELR